MELIVLLFLLGIVLLVAEVFMPGAVLGIIGAVSMIAGCVVSFSQFGAPGGLLATAAALLLLGVALWLEFRVIPRSRLGRHLFIRETVSSTSQAPVGNDSMVGNEGDTLTVLAPSGYVMVGGRRYEAFSNSGHLEAGTRIRVAGHDTFRLIVTKI